MPLRYWAAILLLAAGWGASFFFNEILLRELGPLMVGLGRVGFGADLNALLQFNVGRGEMIYFVGCVAHAVYTPLVPKLNRGEPPVVFAFGMLLAGCMILTIVGWSDIRATDWASLPLIVWVTVFYLGIFASAATFVLLQFAALNLPSAKVMAYTYLVPSWVILWEIGLGNGAPKALVAVGVLMTCVALLMLLRQER